MNATNFVAETFAYGACKWMFNVTKKTFFKWISIKSFFVHLWYVYYKQSFIFFLNFEDATLCVVSKLKWEIYVEMCNLHDTNWLVKLATWTKICQNDVGLSWCAWFVNFVMQKHLWILKDSLGICEMEQNSYNIKRKEN